MPRLLNSFRILLALAKQYHHRYHTGLAVLTGIGALLLPFISLNEGPNSNTACGAFGLALPAQNWPGHSLVRTPPAKPFFRRNCTGYYKCFRLKRLQTFACAPEQVVYLARQ
jgi:hypothetical protein